MLVSEKRLKPMNYKSGDWHDDRGWTDGWDPDVIRCTGFRPEQDRDVPEDVGYQFGSAHANGINTVFGDGSVKFISYTVEQILFNRLGDRMDGLVVDLSRI
jgi:prepilin-type processing-associated H-X9-DG protein